ncbi:MAG: hypothetical protein AAGI38_21300 [Bacteroidota bacterium]
MEKCNYKELSARQKETYNFQKFSAVLADYGFATIRLYDDWQGADFIAQHINGFDYLKVQLKGRLTFDKKYVSKEIYIAFPYQGHWYVYDHDKVLDQFLATFSDGLAVSKSWRENGLYSMGKLSKQVLEMMAPHML